MENSILTIVVVGLLAAGAKLIFLAKLGAFRRVLAFDAWLDVCVGSIFGFLFYGTLTGMVIASIATLAFSGFCFVWKQLMGYERLTLTGYVKVAPRWPLPRVRIRDALVVAGLCVAAAYILL